MPRKRVWVILSLLIVIVLAFGVFGCKAGTATTASPSVAPSLKPSPSPLTSLSPTVVPAPKPTTPAAAPTPAQPQVIKWRGQTQYVAAPPIPARLKWMGGLSGGGGFDVAWKTWIEAKSGGRLQLDIAPPDSIVPTADVMSATEKGSLDFVAHAYAGFHTGVIPEANVEIGLPLAWEDPIEAWDGIYNWGVKELMEETYAKHNIWPLLVPMGDIYAIDANFDISHPDNMKGKKMRALGIYGEFIKAFGGSPAVVTPGDLYMALKLGTVDGAIYGVSGLMGYKFYEVMKYSVVDPNINTIVISFYFNKKSLDALPADLKKLIVEDSPYILNWFTNQYTTEVRYYTHWVESKGFTKLVKWTGEDRKKVYDVGIGLWDTVAKATPQSAKLVDAIKAQAREYGKIK